jgi:hypothetical protein
MRGGAAVEWSCCRWCRLQFERCYSNDVESLGVLAEKGLDYSLEHFVYVHRNSNDGSVTSPFHPQMDTKSEAR